MTFKKITEQDSSYDKLESMSIQELTKSINNEDKTVPQAVERVLPEINRLIEVIIKKLKIGGRLFYIGAGTSGRLGILDASECPPTFGVPDDLVIGLIAGGDKAIRKAQEFSEDSKNQGWKDLQDHGICSNDVVVGIAASGTTPYVVHALKQCQSNQIVTGCITCNPESPITENADFPIEVVVGPEFVTGSSRMKAGTAQKLILNMISTCSMISIGKVKGNKMVDMQLSNDKLIERGTRMIMDTLNVPVDVASELLNQHKNVRRAIETYHENKKNQ